MYMIFVGEFGCQRVATITQYKHSNGRPAAVVSVFRQQEIVSFMCCKILWDF